MIIFYNDQHVAHEGRVEMFRGALVPCFEVAARVECVVDELRSRGVGSIQAPQSFDDAVLSRTHAQRYIDFLRGAWMEWVALDPANAERDALPSYWPIRGFRSDVLPKSFPARMGLFSFDAGTPLTSGTWQAARVGAWCGLSAAHRVLGGDRSAFALTRPPGHHAGHDFFGGYCFLNNAAIAAQALRDGGARRVAVLDIDYHHGNGTQSLFYDRADVFFASVHGDPQTEYPYYLGHADEVGQGAGRGFNLNLPLTRGIGSDGWFAAFDLAMRSITEFKADALVVSLGVDTFGEDPISGFRLVSKDYLRIGEKLARSGLPTVFVFEGGYAVEKVGLNTVNVLDGFQQHSA